MSFSTVRRFRLATPFRNIMQKLLDFLMDMIFLQTLHINLFNTWRQRRNKVECVRRRSVYTTANINAYRNMFGGRIFWMWAEHYWHKCPERTDLLWCSQYSRPRELFCLDDEEGEGNLRDVLYIILWAAGWIELRVAYRYIVGQIVSMSLPATLLRNIHSKC